MGVYVAMDVHRERSQIAIVDHAGVQQRNRNLANDPAQLVSTLAGCRRVPGGVPGGLRPGGGWSSCWRSWGWYRT
jgi:hypothetical protein